MGEKRITNELDNQYRLAGIASSVKEYKLCYHLNLLLGCDFRKLKDLIFEPKDRSRTILFSVLKAGGEGDKNQFIVFTNKNLGECLLPEAANFDYVIQVWGKYSDDDMKALVEGIKLFPGVLMSAEIPLKKVKTRERLVYEEEKPAQKLISTRKFVR